MSTLIFRTIAPLLVAVMLVFSVFITLRGHNEPGGGFIGGLIAASAIAILGMATGATATRKSLRADPLAFAGVGVALAAFSGLISLLFELPFLTGLWTQVFGADISTPMIFDIGVYFTVFGAISAVALGLEDDEEAE